MPRNPDEVCAGCGHMYGALVVGNPLKRGKASVMALNRSERDTINKTLEFFGKKKVERLVRVGVEFDDENITTCTEGEVMRSFCQFCI